MHFAVFFVLVVTAGSYAETSAQKDAVLNLTTSSFEDTLKGNEFVLVAFFAPWCGHCKILDPAYSQAAKQLQDEGIAVKLVKVDAIEEVELANRYEITAYPTLKFFTSGVPTDYTGGFQSEDIVVWLKKKTGPPAKHLKDKDSVAAFKTEAEVAIVGFFKDQESESAQEYLKVARDLDDVLFGITSDSDSFAGHKVQGDSILLFKQFDEGRNDFEGEFNETNIKNFVFIHRLPHVVEFNRHTVPKIFNDGPVKQQAVLFSKRADSEALIQENSQVAKDFKGQFIFVYVNTEVPDNDHVLEFFGLKNDTAPVVRLFIMNDNFTKYQPKSEGVDATSVRQFLQDYLDGNLQPLYLSEDIPEGWDSQPVKVLVGKNFKEVALNKGKAVFVKFYAPWCAHSRHLEPTWNQLGEAYKDSDKIVIAKIDASLNEIEGLRIMNYPTLKYFPSGSDQVIDYTGKRTLAAFKTFLDSDGKETVVEEGETEVKQDEEKKADHAEETEEAGKEVEEKEEKGIPAQEKEKEEAQEEEEEEEKEEDEAKEEEDEAKEEEEEEKDVGEKEDQKDQEEEKEAQEDEAEEAQGEEEKEEDKNEKPNREIDEL